MEQHGLDRCVLKLKTLLIIIITLIALFAGFTKEANADTTTIQVLAENSVYDIVNGSDTTIVSYSVPSTENQTLIVGGWVRTSVYVSGSPYLAVQFVDTYGTSRTIAMRYGGGGGYIIAWVGFADMQTATVIAKNGTAVKIFFRQNTGCTFSSEAWIAGYTTIPDAVDQTDLIVVFFVIGLAVSLAFVVAFKKRR